MKYNHLVIVIGPSGSGKDTLISNARKLLADDAAFYFTTREITRSSSLGGEGHIAVSEDAFLQRDKAGAYAISWHAHDTWYGISGHIEDQLGEGKVVVFNGSRAAINEARKRFPGVKIIFINAPDSLLAHRLSSRGRESDSQVRERLARNRQLREIPDGSIVLTNTGPLQQVLNEFISILHNVRDEVDDSKTGIADKSKMKITSN